MSKDQALTLAKNDLQELHKLLDEAWVKVKTSDQHSDIVIMCALTVKIKNKIKEVRDLE